MIITANIEKAFYNVNQKTANETKKPFLSETVTVTRKINPYHN